MTLGRTAALTAAALVAGYGIASYVYRRKMKELEAMWQSRRQEERTGRIRAEVKLRQLNPSAVSSNEGWTIHPIGTISSPYTKRMGTPRQPTLVPSSRGILDLTVPAACVDGLSEYSHIWILFQFHANVPSNRTKIRPPRAPYKMGQLATRSPHRPNALGLSLVQLEKVEGTRLHLRGLDLVHGTPVYDIKPYNPWDQPATDVRVPDWVTQDDELAEVSWTESALTGLEACLPRLAPLYETVEPARQTLNEVLAQDPRSSHRGVEARGSVSGEAYHLIFGQSQVSFVVNENGVQVTAVEAMDFEPEAYVDGIPLIRH